jgi:hypothetical protein
MEGENAARRSEHETRTILEFLQNNLLSAGRTGDTSLSAAFWSQDRPKDLTLRKSVDATESQIAHSFADSPLAEATVREMIGFAYLSLHEAALAVKQYERALALREAMQGGNDASTASCRNQLAVAYRLAGRDAEAARLFERDFDSLASASTLTASGFMLLVQGQPAEAELKLRAALLIRQKKQPDEWSTFDTMCALGEALADRKKLTEAEPLLLSGYDGLRQRADKIPDSDRPRLLHAREALVKLYKAWGKQEKAAVWQSAAEIATAKKP